MTNANLEVFKKLCDKAQEIIFDEFQTHIHEYGFLEVIDFEECLIKMTPIEQIFYIAHLFVKYKIHNKYGFELIPQETICIDDNIYIADFMIDEFTPKGAPHSFLLNKPLIIELDGFDYHKTKEQANHDYKRENDLKLADFDIIRFTGSQVYNNYYDCIKTIYKYLHKKVKEQEVWQ